MHEPEGEPEPSLAWRFMLRRLVIVMLIVIQIVIQLVVIIVILLVTSINTTDNIIITISPPRRPQVGLGKMGAASLRAAGL